MENNQSIQKTITIPSTTVTFNEKDHSDILLKIRESAALVARCGEAIKGGLEPVNNEIYLEYIIDEAKNIYEQAGKL